MVNFDEEETFHDLTENRLINAMNNLITTEQKNKPF